MNRIIFIGVLCIVLNRTEAQGPQRSTVQTQLMTLVNELQHVRALISDFERTDQQGERYLFRYDVVDRRLFDIVKGIETHISASNQEEKYYRLVREDIGEK